MRRCLFAIAILFGGMLLGPGDAAAYACARGVYRAGCAGPHGAAVYRRPPAYGHTYYRRPPAYGYGYSTYRRPPTTVCRSGYYGAGCVRRW
jgi:hypothetical protein